MMMLDHIYSLFRLARIYSSLILTFNEEETILTNRHFLAKMNDIQSFKVGDDMSKREKIMLAAIDAFKEKGIEKTTISDIVKAAGVAQGTFYLYFPSKLSVMPAIAEHLIAQMVPAIEKELTQHADVLDQADALVEFIFAFTRQYRDVLALTYSGLAATEHLKEWEDIYEPIYKWVAAFLEKAKQDKRVRANLNCQYAAKFIIGLLESSAEQMYLFTETDTEEVLIQKREVKQFLLYALGIETP